MALIKQENYSTAPTPAGVIADQAVETQSWEAESTPTNTVIPPEYIPVSISEPVATLMPATTEGATPNPNITLTSSSPVLAALSEQGFEGLVLDWTSYPGIALKNEGVFIDIDGKDYGKEFLCRLQGSKQRWVYRANPVVDNKRDVAFSYDRISTQNNVLIADKKAEWAAQGKIVEEKEYLEVLVEMVAEGKAYDGEYRILSISPTSKGRFSGHVTKCATLGQGDPAAVITKVLVGAKVTKVQNPFYPWCFEVIK